MASESSSIRPTKGVVVRALRDMLRPVIGGTDVLDLFAGTGRVGRELLEEGAESALGVDRREAPEDLPEAYDWIRRDVPDFVHSGVLRSFDVVYMDPPYDSDHARNLLPDLVDSGLLREQGLVAVETDYSTELPREKPVGETLHLMRRRDYGGTRLWLYQADRDEPGYRGD